MKLVARMDVWTVWWWWWVRRDPNSGLGFAAEKAG